ncbi:LexA family transcriptional regulator [Staphylococcus pseudintermedius]|uniref:Helix-turn-helix domain-containing protein n=1 Tax=Staphylococcus pseudintermedius TaxID=283734 RepID=A0A7T7NYK2_STAPS|nr:XRE family transcriptional regulator [Staphylococcus pseudintermedius]EGQ0292739.1 helix-turn-helix domain-containing protein [Staphylococcus pseudintermedius]EGQ0397060.1 helix-turn-helix domain-containing protein [Staphylococcus pseudintermedius]EGQ0398502.1 helix-turn-helix domain-containing protein [Staphylococcus pseudintermedius]EGQ1274800.1 helix-turn-helix domain-containing protein [Staphylococcus pseudintermedius]EGQ1282316.1 helix-turn-helix domain-containing protein [Staphylococc
MLGNKEVMSKNIRRLMKENNVDRKQLSTDLKVKYTTLSDWINAKTYPRIDKIELLANYFNVNKSDLVEDKTKQQIDTLPVTAIPVVAKISAELPIYTEENIIEYTYISTQMTRGGKELFGLKVSGDSMDKEFREDDVVIVEKDTIVENGQIGVVNVNGYNATVSRVRYSEDKIILLPESNNSDHLPQIYSNDNEIKIVGKVVSSMKFY